MLNLWPSRLAGLGTIKLRYTNVGAALALRRMIFRRQYKDGRDEPPSNDVFTLASVCVPSLPPRKTEGRPWESLRRGE